MPGIGKEGYLREEIGHCNGGEEMPPLYTRDEILGWGAEHVVHLKFPFVLLSVVPDVLEGEGVCVGRRRAVWRVVRVRYERDCITGIGII